MKKLLIVTCALISLFCVIATVQPSDHLKYLEIDTSELFIVGKVEAKITFPHIEALTAWQIRIERVVKGKYNLPLIYIVKATKEEEPFGKNRAVGSRVFLALEEAKTSVPEEAKPKENKDGYENLRCYRVPFFFARAVDNSDSYFRCAILYYDATEDVKNAARPEEKKLWSELSQELEKLQGCVQNKIKGLDKKL